MILAIFWVIFGGFFTAIPTANEQNIPQKSSCKDCKNTPTHNTQTCPSIVDLAHNQCSKAASWAQECCQNVVSADVQNPQNKSKNLGKVTILMYHNLMPNGYPSGKYCVTTSQLESDFEYLKDNGYNVISFAYLYQCITEQKPLPNKAILLTFDDGYLTNVTLGLPLLKKYNYTALFSVVGEFCKYGKSNPDIKRGYEYLEWEDVAKYADEKHIEWGIHSFGMHHLKPRKGVSKKYGESADLYKQNFRKDTIKMLQNFEKVGIKPIVYAYPYGLFTPESEEILRELNIPFTLTCGESSCTIKVDRLPRLLGRFNRSGLESLESILARAK